MATLTIRNLPDHVHAALRARALANGRSMEAEARQNLERAMVRSKVAVDREKADAAFEEIRAQIRAANGGVMPTGIVDEFIAERREEARREWEDSIPSTGDNQ
jgi:plasmid stability protein